MYPAVLRFLILSVGVVLASPNHIIPAEPKSEVSPSKSGDLVQQLVSPNKAAETRNTSSGSVKFPEGYDVESQRRLNAARKQLQEEFEDALPFLVASLGDERYCMTIDWAEGDAYYNFSVGNICRDVIASQLEVYRDKIRFLGPQHWNRYNYGPVTKEWLQARRGQSLAMLQVEAIDWAIKRRIDEAKEKDLDVATEISELQKLRDSISKTGTPAPPRRLLPMVTANKGRPF